MRRLLLAASMVAVLVACGDGNGDDDQAADTLPAVSAPDGTESPPSDSSASTAPVTNPTDPPSQPTPPTLVATPITPTSVVSGPPAPGFQLDPALPIVTAAVADLAGRLGIDPSDVTVVDARSVTWGDSSLGCPEPGMNYLQRLVDGSLVVLKAGGKQYEYHGGDPLFLCENPRPPSGGD